MERRALITGATGFVGGHLAKFLASEGWAVRALVRPSSRVADLEALEPAAELVRGDLGDERALGEACAGATVIFHLAAVTGLRKDQDFERANVEGTRRLVEAARAARPRPDAFVYLSSYAACGPAVEGRPRRVEETPAPLTEYGRTKLAGEDIVRSLEGCGVRVVILRAPPVYGPGDHAFLPYFKLVSRGIAPRPSGPDRRVHMLYVEDLAAALAHAAEAPAGIYAVAEPVDWRWSEVVEAFGRALGRTPIRVALPAPLVRAAAAATQAVGRLLGRATVFNSEKAEEMLADAWVCDLTGSEAVLPRNAVTPLDEGLARTVRWYRRQGWL